MSGRGKRDLDPVELDMKCAVKSAGDSALAGLLLESTFSPR